MTWPPHDYPDYPEYPALGYGPPVYPPSSHPPSGFSAAGSIRSRATAHPRHLSAAGLRALPAPPSYPPTPGYALPSGYGSPPPYGFGIRAPGIIPLRPLSLTDIFNGAASYIRTNMKATLGLTAIIVVTTQIITLIATVGPLAAASRLRTAPADELTGGYITAWLLSAGLAGLVGWLAGLLLSGMLTVVVSRAVFGWTIGPGETWARIRGRLPALIGLVALESVGLIILCGLVGLIVAAVGAAASPAAAVLIGCPWSLSLSRRWSTSTRCCRSRRC